MAKGNGGTRGQGPAQISGGRTIAPVSGDGVRSFLLSYTPKEEGFTSNEEIELVAQKLGLNDMNEDELRSMRNRAVSIYNNAMEKEIKYDENGEYAGRTDKYWEYSEGMMSVTAIIDYIRNRRGTPVSML